MLDVTGPLLLVVSIYVDGELSGGNMRWSYSIGSNEIYFAIEAGDKDDIRFTVADGDGSVEIMKKEINTQDASAAAAVTTHASYILIS